MIRAITLDIGCTLIYESSCIGESPSNTLVESLKALTNYLIGLGYEVRLDDVVRAIRSWKNVRSKYFSEFMEFDSKLRMHYMLSFLGIKPKPKIVYESLKVVSNAAIRSGKIYSDVEGFLKWTRSRGLSIAAVSNASNHDEVVESLKHFGIIDYFDIVITSNITIYKKPLKEIFEITSQLLDAKPKELIHIGDSLADIQGALSAGYNSAIEIARHRACITVNCAKNLHEVMSIINQYI